MLSTQNRIKTKKTKKKRLDSLEWLHITKKKTSGSFEHIVPRLKRAYKCTQWKFEVSTIIINLITTKSKIT